MERCPCCKARLAGAEICPRCQADLGAVIGCEQHAQHWLRHAVRFWFEHEPMLAMLALIKSLRLNKTASSLIFCDFIVRQQRREVLSLLAEHKLTEAERRLCLLRELQPDNELFMQLHGFACNLATGAPPYQHCCGLKIGEFHVI
ncbi:MAG: hypothetical protein ACU83U_03010 [Gammaproteobacteria bacterium]